MTEQEEIHKWVIRHPGTGVPLTCNSFDECMDLWFEGFNIPFHHTNGIRESFDDANERVKEYYRQGQL